MSERTRDRERETVDLDAGVDADTGLDAGIGTDVGLDAGAEADRAGGTGPDESSGLTDRAKERATSVFAPRSFLLLLGGALAGVFGLGSLIPVVPFTGFVGLFLMMVVVGLIARSPRYLEAGLAGAAGGALGLFVGSITLSVVTGGLPLLVGGTVGAALAIGGFYAGRDLRDGLTREL